MPSVAPAAAAAPATPTPAPPTPAAPVLPAVRLDKVAPEVITPPVTTMDLEEDDITATDLTVIEKAIEDMAKHHKDELSGVKDDLDEYSEVQFCFWCHVCILWLVKSFNFMDMKFCGLIMMGMFLGTWIHGFQIKHIIT